MKKLIITITILLMPVICFSQELYHTVDLSTSYLDWQLEPQCETHICPFCGIEYQICESNPNITLCIDGSVNNSFGKAPEMCTNCSIKHARNLRNIIEKTIESYISANKDVEAIKKNEADRKAAKLKELLEQKESIEKEIEEWKKVVK